MPVVCYRPARSNLTVITRYFSLNSLGNKLKPKGSIRVGFRCLSPSLCYGVSVNVAYAHHDNNRNVSDECI